MIFNISFFNLIISLCLFCFIIFLIKKRILKEEYSYLWIFLVVIMMCCSSNRFISFFASFFGVKDPPHILFFFAVLILFLFCLFFSVIISKKNMQIKKIAIELSCLKREIKDLKKK